MKEDHLCTIGMLTFKKSPVDQIPFLRQRAILAEASLHNIKVVLLEGDNYSIEREEIQGYVWSGSQWDRKLVRIPDLVIIIGSERTPSQGKITSYIRSNRMIIEDIGMNKQKAAEKFAATGLKKYLIPSEEVRKVGTKHFFFEILSKYPDGIVVKRTTANQGVGLIFAIRTPDGKYEVKKGSKSFEGSKAEVSDYLTKSIAGRLEYRDYLAQEYIRSCTLDSRSFDIRVHLQKRRDGQWAVTRDYVRLAEYHNPLPNTSKGGYQGSLKLFLQSRYDGDSEVIRKRILDAALQIAKTQDSLTKRPLSELGIDLLLDNSDNVKLIETNSLPQTFYHEHLRAIYFLEYILFLFENRVK